MNAAQKQLQLEKAVANQAHKEELRRLQIKKKEAAIELSTRQKQVNLDIKAGKALNVIQLNQLRAATDASRVDAENTALVAPITTTAVVEAADTEARAKLVRALPWIIGGVVVIGGLVYLKRRSSR